LKNRYEILIFNFKNEIHFRRGECKTLIRERERERERERGVDRPILNGKHERTSPMITKKGC
jgi:hypothetical protein